MAKKRFTNDVRIKNSKARYEFELMDDFVAGIQLAGTEIKSIRETFNGKLSSVTKFDESGNIIEIDSWSHMRNRAYRKYIKR